MPITNLNSVHYTSKQMADITAAVQDLKAQVQFINVPLTPEERQQYGSVNEQNKLLVNKVRDYQATQPTLGADNVDWAEFEADYQSRLFLEGIINNLEGIIINLKNAKTLYDFDNYQAALADYANANYRAGQGTPNFEGKMNELKQFFPRTGKTVDPPIQ